MPDRRAWGATLEIRSFVHLTAAELNGIRDLTDVVEHTAHNVVVTDRAHDITHELQEAFMADDWVPGARAWAHRWFPVSHI